MRWKTAIHGVVLTAAVYVSAGCVEIKQEIHMNHDGSGKIVETIALTARGQRLLEGMKKRAGKGKPVPDLLSESEFQKRLKSMGEVALDSKKEVKLKDGRTRIDSVYTFKDINKVTLWIAPTYNYAKTQKERRDGKLKFKWKQGPYEMYSSLYREHLFVHNDLVDGVKPIKTFTPAERQKYKDVLPAFMEMLKDFSIEIVLVAPIESFEEKNMTYNVPLDGNRVTLFKMKGKDVMEAPTAVLQTVMNEMHGRKFRRMENKVPDVFTTLPHRHRGYQMRFAKAEGKVE